MIAQEQNLFVRFIISSSISDCTSSRVQDITKKKGIFFFVMLCVMFSSLGPKFEIEK